MALGLFWASLSLAVFLAVLVSDKMGWFGWVRGGGGLVVEGRVSAFFFLLLLFFGGEGEGALLIKWCVCMDVYIDWGFGVFGAWISGTFCFTVLSLASLVGLFGGVAGVLYVEEGGEIGKEEKGEEMWKIKEDPKKDQEFSKRCFPFLPFLSSNPPSHCIPLHRNP